MSDTCSLSARFTGCQLDLFADLNNPDTYARNVEWRFRIPQPLEACAGAILDGNNVVFAGETMVATAALRLASAQALQRLQQLLIRIDVIWTVLKTGDIMSDGDTRTLHELLMLAGSATS